MMKLYSLDTAAKMAVVIVLIANSLIYSSLVIAQATVRDSSPVTSNPTTRSATNSPIINNSAVPSGAATAGVISSGSSTSPAQLVNSPPPVSLPNTSFQIRQLQQEISELRGLVEEQAFQLKRLKQQRLDDYLDLDQRLSELTNPSNVSNAEVLTNQSSSSQSSASTANTITGLSNNLPKTSSDDAAEGKKLYRKAIDQLLNKQDYSGAQNSFAQYLDKYPSGVYVPNVYYWQGQIFLTESKKTEAVKAFTNLISQYKDHQKTPDAKYKLATIYFDQGKKAEAKTLLNEVVASDTDASRLARSFLANQY